MHICERCRLMAGVSFCDCFWMCLRCQADYLAELDAEAKRDPKAKRKWRVIGHNFDKVESYFE